MPLVLSHIAAKWPSWSPLLKYFKCPLHQLIMILQNIITIEILYVVNDQQKFSKAETNISMARNIMIRRLLFNRNTGRFI